VDMNGVSTDAARASDEKHPVVDWSVLNYGGFGRKPEFSVPEAQWIPSHLRAFGWINGTAIPVQAWTGRLGSSKLRLPDFKTVGI